MHITELRLHGFKSFVDSVRAPIEQGLTGVVGPNGCGKSNLLEAVRWVMGAASAKSMRAADMDDVIFSGSSGRPPREHAEVTLVLADAAGRAPAPFDEERLLEVSRRIRRGLGSVYRINGKEVRAKDVQLLFADAATGANSPALVRQGQVNELIAAKPENRRRILEDAAGIAGLYARRHESDLKLRAAEANLARLDEVLAEIDAQAQGLKRQARQAERYRGLAQMLRETEALLMHRRWRLAQEQLSEAQSTLREAERITASAAAEASAAARDAATAQDALAPLREEGSVAAAVLRRLEGVRVGLERDLQDAQGELARCDEAALRASQERVRIEALAADAEASLQRLAAEAEALSRAESPDAGEALARAEAAHAAAASARNAAESRLEELAAAAAAERARAEAAREAAAATQARLARFEQRAAALASQDAALPRESEVDARVEAAQSALERSSASAAEARAALTAGEAALADAEKEAETARAAFAGAESAVRALAAEIGGLEKLVLPRKGHHAPVLDEIEVAPGYERALAAALGDDLNASLNAGALEYWAGAKAPQPLLPPSALSLTLFVKGPAELAARFALIGVVDAERGDALAGALPPGARLVSREGDLWRWDGFVRRADAPLPAATRLETRARIAAAHAELEERQAALEAARAVLARADAARAAALAAAQTQRRALPGLERAAADAQRLLDGLESERKRVRERRADLAAQSATLAAERGEADTALQLPEAAAQRAPVDADALASARTEVEQLRAAAAAAQAAAEAAIRERAQIAARRQAVAADAEAWRGRRSDFAQRLDALARELSAIAGKRRAAEALPEQIGAQIEALLADASAAERRRLDADDRVAAAEAAARAAAHASRATEAAHAAAREARAGAEALAAAAAQRLSDLAGAIHEKLAAAPEALANLAGALAAGPLASASLQEIERRLERLKSERDAAGPVNLRADEELAEAQARIDALVKEKADVADAVAKLRRAITALNSEGRTRLMRAFEEVSCHFAELFATLFEGGQATLRLTESEDPLDAGLEIFAEPPGKRLSHLSLLSGGEQALTATALIFAVFLANPAPLCVLDEIDAPLDDANVDRFCRLLDDMKQRTSTRFIVITHNPVTMSRMDRLYGVTMPEQGVSQLVSVDLGRAQAMAAE